MLPTATTTTQPQPPPPVVQPLRRRLRYTSTPAKLSVLRAVFIVLALVFAVVGAFGVNQRHQRCPYLGDVNCSRCKTSRFASSTPTRSPARRTCAAGKRTRRSAPPTSTRSPRPATDWSLFPVQPPTPTSAQLSEASRLLGSYVGLVEQARANNRQGFPVGAAYQRQANGIVSNADPDTPDIVSSLRAVEESQRTQINASLASAHRAGVWLHCSGWLLMLALLAGSLWLSRTFRRVINIPIAVAAVALLLLLVIGGTTQAGAVSDADSAVGSQLAKAGRVPPPGPRRGVRSAFARGIDVDQPRQRSRQRSQLVQGSDYGRPSVGGGPGSASVCRAAAGNAYRSYRDAHVEIRELDDKGDWDKAVDISLGKHATSTQRQRR